MTNKDLYNKILSETEQDINSGLNPSNLNTENIKYSIAGYPPTTTDGTPVRASLAVSAGGAFRVSVKNGKFLISVKPAEE